MKATKVAHRAAHFGIFFNGDVFAEVIVKEHSVTSPINVILLGLGSRELNNESKTGRAKWFNMLRQSHNAVLEGISMLMGEHGRVYLDHENHSARIDVWKDARRELAVASRAVVACKTKNEAKGNALRVEYLTTVNQEMLQLRNHLRDLITEMRNIPSQIIDLHEMQDDEPACTICTARQTPLQILPGSWHEVNEATKLVVDTLAMCSNLRKAARAVGGKPLENALEITTELSVEFTAIDSLVMLCHPFMYGMEQKLQQCPFFTQQNEEKLRQLISLATEIWKETINGALDAAGVVEDLRMTSTDDTYNGFAEGATLLGELQAGEHLSVCSAYGIDPDEICRSIWF